MEKNNRRHSFAVSRIGLFLLCAMLSLSLHAQSTSNKTITGKTTDISGEVLPSVNVLVKGTSVGVMSDMDGNYTITLPDNIENPVLEFSFIGFSTKEEVVGTRTVVNVSLSEEANKLDEVVVVGYGSMRKENLTGAVASINVKDVVASRPVTDVSKALQGISPGLSITTNQGGLGMESQIRLRGATGSLSATEGTSPLILLDNVEIPSLNLINPDDIESISVLKDAAASSIYGTRAAWGVILITSKAGRLQEKVNVSYSNNFAWNTPTKLPKMSSSYQNAEYMMLIADRDRPGAESVTSIGYNVDREAIQKMRDWDNQYGGMSQSELGEMVLGRDFEIRGGKTYFYRQFDPIKEFTKKWTPQQNHNLSIRGGGEKSVYNMSLGYLTQSGVMKFNTDKYERFNFNSGITSNIRKWWKVRANAMFTRGENKQPYRYTSGLYDAWYYLLRWPSFYPYATYDGKDFRSAVTDTKQANTEREISNYMRINVGTEITPIDNLSLNFDYTFSLLNDQIKKNGGRVFAYNMFTGNPTMNYGDIYGDTHDRVIQNSKYTTSNVFKAYATYEKLFGEKHNVKVMGGMDSESRDRSGHYSEARGMYNYDQPEMNLTYGDMYSRGVSTGLNKYKESFHNDFAAMGFFGRVNYNYAHKYLFEFNGRYDGSSAFPKGKKWAFFPSFSAGWRVSDEYFMDWSKSVLNSLKLRGSWGTIGSQDVGEHKYLSIMQTSPGSGWIEGNKQLPSIKDASVISPALTWERITTLDFGLDARILNDKVGITFDWYQRVTSDMHSPGMTLPASFGAAIPLRNYGELKATGFELAIDFNHQFANGLAIGARASLSNVTEKITKYNNVIKDIKHSTTAHYEGERLGDIWGHETDRLFQESDFNKVTNNDGSFSYELKEGIASQDLYEGGGFKFGPGDVKYKDIDGDGRITYGSNTADDRGDLKVIGNSLPRYEYSFGFNVSFKGVDFSTLFQGVGSRDYWGTGTVVVPGFMPTEGAFDHHMDYWTPENTGAFYPRPTNHSWIDNGRNFVRQSRYLLDMSYLRCKNITLGYTFPKTLINKIALESTRIYFSVENVFEFTNLDIPVDPESTNNKNGNTQGYSFGRSYPYMRTISFGVQIGF